jgi:large repetitive protein
MFNFYLKRTKQHLLAATFSLLALSGFAQNNCTVYTVNNVNNVCGCSEFLFRPYGLYVETPNGCGVEYYKADTVFFIVNDTAAFLKGTFRTFSDWRPILVDIQFAKTTARTPRLELCNRDSSLNVAALWRYFGAMSGTMKFDTDPSVSVSSRNGGLFQMGIGASGQNATTLGASGQFSLSNGKVGGFGFTLSNPSPTTCPIPVNPCLADAEPPSFINCPANISGTTTQTSAIVNWTPPTAIDNCSTPSVSSNFSPGQTFPTGVTTVIYTARDARNNTSQCRFTVGITQVFPVTGCVKYNVDNTNNICGCTDAQFRPYGIYLESPNNCSLEYYKADTVSFQVNADSTARLRGTFRSLTWQPVVVDIFFQKTTLKLPKIELCNRDSAATIAINWRYFGNMVGTIKVGNDLPISVSSRGLFQMGNSANSQNGNQLGASGQFSMGNISGGFGFSLSSPQNVTCLPPPNFCLNDSIPPAFSNCPANIVINTPLTSAVATWTTPTATDACTINPSVSSNYTSGQTFQLGTTNVIYTARDSANNRAECRFSVTVNQVIPLNCTKYRLDNTQNICGCTASQWVPFGLYLEDPINNCNISYFKADDAYFQVNEDSTATLRGTFRSQTWQPIFVNVTFAKTTLRTPRSEGCNRDSTATLAASWRYFGAMRGFIQFDSSSIYNVNSGNTLTQIGVGANNQNSRELGGNGTFTLSNNQRGGFSFLLTNPLAVACTIEPNPCANDVTKPVFNSCPTTINVGTYQSSSVANWVVPTAYDNCNTPSVTSNFVSGQVFPVGVTTVSYVAKDAANNTATCSFAINIFRLPPPTGCNKYTVENTNNACGCANLQWQPYGFYLETTGTCGVEYFKADSVVFQANSDSTGSLKGRFRSQNWVPILVDLTFAKPTSKTPRFENCNRDSTASVAADWRYLGAMTGTVKFDTFPAQSITSRNGNFQFGKGASGQNPDLFGASGQFSLANGQKGGFAFLLSNSQVAECPFVPNPCLRDTVPPIFNNCPTNINVLTSQNTIAINWTMPTARDNCSTPLILSNFQPGQLLPIGQTTVVYLARDTSGNQTECRFIVTVTKITATQDPSVSAFKITSFSPNPAFDLLNVDVINPVQGNVAFALSNALGQVVEQKTVWVNQGENRLSFNVGHLPKGVYWLKPTSVNGHQSIVKFLKM